MEPGYEFQNSSDFEKFINLHSSELEKTPTDILHLPVKKGTFSVGAGELTAYTASGGAINLKEVVRGIPRGQYNVEFKGSGPIQFPDESGILCDGTTGNDHPFTIIRQTGGGHKAFGWLDR